LEYELKPTGVCARQLIGHVNGPAPSPVFTEIKTGYNDIKPAVDVIQVDGVKGYTTYQLRLLLGPDAKSCYTIFGEGRGRKNDPNVYICLAILYRKWTRRKTTLSPKANFTNRPFVQVILGTATPW
jgi:hypothetical protein